MFEFPPYAQEMVQKALGMGAVSCVPFHISQICFDSRTLLKCMYELGISVIKCLGYFRKIHPDCVIGTGGYVSAPALIAAISLYLMIRKPEL